MRHVSPICSLTGRQEASQSLLLAQKAGKSAKQPADRLPEALRSFLRQNRYKYGQ